MQHLDVALNLNSFLPLLDKKKHFSYLGNLLTRADIDQGLNCDICSLVYTQWLRLKVSPTTECCNMCNTTYVPCILHIEIRYGSTYFHHIFIDKGAHK